MLTWRCFVVVLMFWTALIALSCSGEADAESFYEKHQADPRARVFFLCVDRLQMEIELGLKPDMSSEQALQICSKRTETVLESLSDNGLEQAGEQWGIAF